MPTGSGLRRRPKIGLQALLVISLTIATTLTISLRDPLALWSYEIASFALATAALWKWDARVRISPSLWVAALSLAAIALWGWLQLAFNATEYRYATLDAALRFSAYGAIALASAWAFSSERRRELLIEVLAKFGFAVAVIGLVSYRTSAGKLLWFFPNPYPDSWGPFLSRNNFAQFLELALPAAMWHARRGDAGSIAMVAAMLAAGFASASRAGAVLLSTEMIVCAILIRSALARRRGQTPNGAALKLAAWAAAFLVIFTWIAGASEVWNRFLQPDPVRREIASSAVAIIRDRPWSGFGLGTFAAVYPAYATFDPGAVVDHAHSDWLEWTCEGGVGFAAAWVVLGVALAPRAFRSVWGLGVPALLAHAALDYPFARPGVAGWFFLVAGALLAKQFQGESRPGAQIREMRVREVSGVAH